MKMFNYASVFPGLNEREQVARKDLQHIIHGGLSGMNMSGMYLM